MALGTQKGSSHHCPVKVFNPLWGRTKSRHEIGRYLAMIKSKQHQATLRKDTHIVDISTTFTTRLNAGQIISLEKRTTNSESIIVGH